MSHLKQHLAKKNKIALIITMFGIVVPFIKYNGFHLLLFNFHDSRFEFIFHVWEVSTIYLIAIFVLFAIALILVLNFTFSRYFCGTMCPKTILKYLLTDIIKGKIFKISNIQNKYGEEKIEKHKFKTVLSYITFFMVVFIGSIPFFFYLLPYEIVMNSALDGFNEYKIILYAWLIISIYLFVEALFFKEFFCSYICPYQLINTITVMKDRSFFNFFDKNSCIKCDACVKICPIQNLDIKNGFDVRCISCGDCSAICADIMEKSNHHKSLIKYSDFEINQNKSTFFSFANAKKSLILVAISIITISLIISYLLSIENLGYCSFNNGFIYKN